MCKLKKIETMLLLILAMLFTYASAISVETQNISDKVFRLHVLANSDSEQDQELKLMVRDAVLEYCEPLIENASTQNEVKEILTDNMQEIADIAKITLENQQSSDIVTVELAQEYYPTREYETFSLPAGNYTGLKVKIGEAQGQNWWCVVFPPMCNNSAIEEDTTLTESEQAFTRQDGTQYVIRFKTAEIIANLIN